jgi:hypothetical protein
VEDDRESLVEILVEWLTMGTPGQFSWALVLAKKLGLHELKQEIAAQKQKIERGEKLNKTYIASIVLTLQNLK